MNSDSRLSGRSGREADVAKWSGAERLLGSLNGNKRTFVPGDWQLPVAAPGFRAPGRQFGKQPLEFLVISSVRRALKGIDFAPHHIWRRPSIRLSASDALGWRSF
jgi:hypothetical protein